jgi:alpha-D-xyloside xylohydrolase
MDIMPLYIKAGSIIPMGPLLEYATEKPAEKIELRIYPGADGSFRLYEDANDTYNYEKGEFANINFNWNDAKRELSISARTGSFPRMLKNRIFNVVVVKDGNGLGGDETTTFDKVVKYDGRAVTVKIQ